MPRMHVHVRMTVETFFRIRLALLGQYKDFSAFFLLHLLSCKDGLPLTFDGQAAIFEEVVVDVGREIDLVSIDLGKALEDARFEHPIHSFRLLEWQRGI